MSARPRVDLEKLPFRACSAACFREMREISVARHFSAPVACGCKSPPCIRERPSGRNRKAGLLEGRDSVATTITWTNTIKGQFNEYDTDHMKQITGNALKLDDYENVKVWAGQIWDQVSNGFMPPGDPWTDTQK